MLPLSIPLPLTVELPLALSLALILSQMLPVVEPAMPALVPTHEPLEPLPPDGFALAVIPDEDEDNDDDDDDAAEALFMLSVRHSGAM